MNLEAWLVVVVGSFLGGVLSFAITHFYYRRAIVAAQKQHDASVSRMLSQHAEQILFSRTLLKAMEKQFGLKVATDSDGNLTGGFHYQGKVLAAPLGGVAAVLVGKVNPPAE